MYYDNIRLWTNNLNKNYNMQYSTEELLNVIEDRIYGKIKYMLFLKYRMYDYNYKRDFIMFLENDCKHVLRYEPMNDDEYISYISDFYYEFLDNKIDAIMSTRVYNSNEFLIELSNYNSTLPHDTDNIVESLVLSDLEYYLDLVYGSIMNIMIKERIVLE